LEKNENCLAFLNKFFPKDIEIGGDSQAFVEFRFIGHDLATSEFHPVDELSTNLISKCFGIAESKRANLFFGVGARKSMNSGKKENIGYINAAWVDIDEKDSLRKDEAMKLLNEWVLKPTYIIDSGHGIHAYWILREPIHDPEEFMQLEKINKRLVSKFMGDKNCTDFARIMRLPGSINFKDVPIEAKILQSSEQQYELFELEEWLPSETRALDPKLSLSSGLNHGDYNKEEIEEVINSCAFLAHCRDDAQNLSEPEWYMAITNLAALGDKEIVHELSKPFAKYSFEETERKIEHALLDSPGPHTCKTIQESGFDGCKNCKFANQVKSPAAIASKLRFRKSNGIVSIGTDMEYNLYLWDENNSRLHKLDKLTMDRFTLITGQTISDKDFKIEKSKILENCSRRIISDFNTLGLGIWNVDNDFLIVSGPEAYLKNGSKIRSPAFKDKFIDFRPHISAWYTPATHRRSLSELFTIVKEIVSHWNFQQADMIPLMTAFIFLAPFQHLMNWRPHIYITGRQGTGKTSFFEFLEELYGPLVTRLDDSTPYGLAQKLGKNNMIGLMDEFEHNRRRASVMEALKKANSGQGGSIVRGTTGISTIEFKLHHMIWISSIENGARDAAQRARLATFILDPHDNESLHLPSKEEFALLRSEMVDAMLENWDKIENLASDYRQSKRELLKDKAILDGRIVDNYAYAAAVWNLCEPGTGGLPDYIEEIEVNQDEQELLDDILNSQISISGNNYAVSEVLSGQATFEVENYGVKIVNSSNDNKTYIAINPKSVVRHLLEDTRWRELDIASILLRYPGAIKKKAKISGKSTNCVLIPYEEVFKE